MTSATTIMAVAAAVSAGVAIKSSMDQKSAAQKSLKQQDAAQRQSQANADAAASQADQDMNKANQKRPDTMALLDQATQAGKAGPSGTMLTGAQGVDTSALSLGKNTLLGA